MAAARGRGRGAAAVLPPARCGRHSSRDTQLPLKTPPRGSSRGSLPTLLTCLQVCLPCGEAQGEPCLASARGDAPEHGARLERGALVLGCPELAVGCSQAPGGKHLYQAHVAVVALVSAKSLVTAGVPRAALPSSPLGGLAAQPGPGHSWVLYGAVRQSPVRHHHPGTGLGLCSPMLAGAVAFLLFPS